MFLERGALVADYYLLLRQGHRRIAAYAHPMTPSAIMQSRQSPAAGRVLIPGCPHPLDQDTYEDPGPGQSGLPKEDRIARCDITIAVLGRALLPSPVSVHEDLQCGSFPAQQVDFSVVHRRDALRDLVGQRGTRLP